MALDYGSVKSYSERGFGFVTRTLDSRGQDVFFHIKVVRRRYPGLADDLDRRAGLDDDFSDDDNWFDDDDNPYRGIRFWYETELTAKGEQVRELWLTAAEIPEPQLSKIRSTIEQIWQESQWRLPSMEAITQSVLGEGGYQRLTQALEDRLRAQQELAEQRRRSQEDERRREIEREAERLQREAELAAGRATVEPTIEVPGLQSEVEYGPFSDEDLEWQEAVELEKFLHSESRLGALAQRPLPSTQAHQTSSRGSPSTESGSSDQTGWWYEQLKGRGAPRVIDTKVVGVTYENRQSVVRKLTEGEQVCLCREPANPYDYYAIAVTRQTGEKIGYISRYEAAVLAPSFDEFGEPVVAVVTAIVGGHYSDSALGVRIRFTAPEAGAEVFLSLPDYDDDWEF